MTDTFVHPTAEIAANAEIGAGTHIWMNVQIREGARIGKNCNIGRNAYIDVGVQVGDNCKVHNNAMVFADAVLEDGVFIGPGAILTNDKRPRAINADGSLKQANDWKAGHVQVKKGASIGAGASVLTDLVIGPFALIGAGAVVTHDVPAHALMVGVPARLVGYVCQDGHRLAEELGVWVCSEDGRRYRMDSDGGLEELHPR